MRYTMTKVSGVQENAQLSQLDPIQLFLSCSSHAESKYEIFFVENKPFLWDEGTFLRHQNWKDDRRTKGKVAKK